MRFNIMENTNHGTDRKNPIKPLKRKSNSFHQTFIKVKEEKLLI